jgi:hypothetical protein
MVFRCFLAAVAYGCLLSGCSGVIDPSKNKVETFTGTLAVGATVTFPYSWAKNGEIEVTMTSVTPTPANGPISMAIGDNASGTCLGFQGYSAQAIVNRKVQFGVLNKGNYCLIIYDPFPSALIVPVNFAGTFSHP